MTTSAQDDAGSAPGQESAAAQPPRSEAGFRLTVFTLLIHCVTWAAAAIAISTDGVYFASSLAGAIGQLVLMGAAGAMLIVLGRNLTPSRRRLLIVVTVLLFVPSGPGSLLSLAADATDSGQTIIAFLWLLRPVTIMVSPLIVAAVLTAVEGRIPDPAVAAAPPSLSRLRRSAHVASSTLALSALMIAVGFAFEPTVGSFADISAASAALTAVASLSAAAGSLFSLRASVRLRAAGAGPGAHTRKPGPAQILTFVTIACAMAAFMVSASRMLGDGADLYFGPIAGPTGMGGTVLTGMLLAVISLTSAYRPGLQSHRNADKAK